MSGDGAETDHDRDDQPAFADDRGEKGIAQILCLQLLCTAFAEVLEDARETLEGARGRKRPRYSQESAKLAEDRTGGDDAKPDPGTPNVSTEQGNKLVPEELGARDID